MDKGAMTDYTHILIDHHALWRKVSVKSCLPLRV